MKSRTKVVSDARRSLWGCQSAPLGAVHDGDPIGHRERFLLIVRDVDEGRPKLGLDPLELELHLLAEFHVERASARRAAMPRAC